MIDESGQVSAFGRVDDASRVDPKEVTATDAHLLVVGLSFICDALSDALPDVLYHHLVSCDVLHGVQTPSMDTTLGKLQLLLTELEIKNGEKRMN